MEVGLSGCNVHDGGEFYPMCVCVLVLNFFPVRFGVDPLLCTYARVMVKFSPRITKYKHVTQGVIFDMPAAMAEGAVDKVKAVLVRLSVFFFFLLNFFFF